MKISVDESSVKRVENNIKQSIKKVLNNKTMMNEVANTVITDIQVQTRRGNSIPLNGKFPSLSKSWKERRSEIAVVESTHNAYSKNRSNLTLTGQLLDSLKHRFISAGKFIIEATGIHEPYYYVGKKGDHVKVGNRVDNKRLARYVAEQGRPFMGVRESLIPRLKRIIIGYIRRSSNVIIKTKNNE